MRDTSNNAETTRNALLDTAEELIRKRGGEMELSVQELASACGISTNSFYQYYEDKDCFYEALAGRWFQDLTDAMEAIVESSLPPREKLFQFFSKRLDILHSRWQEDPVLFENYLGLGDAQWEVIRGYVDLADHYMAGIISEAMAEGHFKGLDIDHIVSLVNLMVQPFVNPRLMAQMERIATTQNLHIIIGTIFSGLNNVTFKGDDNITKMGDM